MSRHFEEALSSWRECREEFELLMLAAYERAAEATNGRLLNDRGVRAGVDSLSLFKGNSARARAYASEELLEHWRAFPRVTFDAFEREWIRDRERV